MSFQFITLFYAIFLVSTLNFVVQAKDVWISVGSDILANSSFAKEKFSDTSGVSIVKVAEEDLLKLSTHVHQNSKRCGGFFIHDSAEEGAKAVLNSVTHAENLLLFDYTIDQKAVVESLIEEVKEKNVVNTIEKLSSFHNRYYKSSYGLESSQWIFDFWSKMSSFRSDIKVEKFKHRRSPQPSVVLTIEGTDLKDEVVIVGGHADSISGFWNREKSRAPGADDNASGISSFTEAMRVLIESDYRPKRTLKFMAYAAEEVGLVGSDEIARYHREKDINVVGVIQFDMTNFNGSDLDIVMMNDFTNADQNKFIGRLIDRYIELPWGYSSCGYACSDHASWTRAGFPSSIPFEAKKEDMNRKIHTSKDLIEISDNNAYHAVKFAKLALAYSIEMGK